MARALVSRLMGALATSEVDMLIWQGHLPCLLWALAMGTVAAEGDKDGMANWFIANFQGVVQALGLETGSEAEKSLKLFVWDESFTQLFSQTSWIRASTASPSRLGDYLI